MLFTYKKVMFLCYSYVYGEKVDITMTTALPLLYAAKKYLLDGLLKECVQMMQKSIEVETVCSILQQSVKFAENALRDECLQFIAITSRSVFASEGFLCLTHDVLSTVLDMATMSCSERTVFESCVKWARHQLRESGNDNPSDGEIRHILGDVLYLIRFPTMTAKEFAELAASSEVLTSEEKNDVFIYKATNKKLESLKFGTNRRQRFAETILERLMVTRSSLRNCRMVDAIDFQTTVLTAFIGVGLYGGEKGSAHGVTVQVLQDDKVLARTARRIVSVGDKTPIRVELEKPVLIRSNVRYTLQVMMKGAKTWWGDKGAATYDFDGCGNVSFYESAFGANENGSYVYYGQIPQLMFSAPQQVITGC